MSLLRFAARAITGQVAARAVSLAVPFVILHLHAPGVLTDMYFLLASITLLFHTNVANSITDATVPLEHRNTKTHADRFWTLVSLGVGASLLFVTLLLLPASFPYPLTMASGIALTAGCGLFGGYLTGILHAHHKYLATGMTWLYRLLPLALYWILSPHPAWLSWLALGIGLVDALRAYTLYRLTRPHRATRNRQPAPLHMHIVGHYWPAVLSAMLPGLNPIINRTIAAFDGAGGISLLETGDRLYSVVGGLATVGIMNVVLTHLSRSHANGSFEREWSRIMRLTLGWSVLWLAIGLLAGYLVFDAGYRTPFKMDAMAMSVTRDIYYYYTAGLPAFIVGIVYVRRLYATGNISLLVPTAAASVAANAIGGYGLYWLLGLPGIALASTVVYSAMTLALILLTRRDSVAKRSGR